MTEAATSPEFRFSCKVYYEDTDCQGVVYHANYLKFLERARTEFLAARGTPVQEAAQQGYLFVVYRIDATFRAPARLGDSLEVVTSARVTSSYRVTFDQRIELARQPGKALLKAEVEVVCIDPKDGNLRPIPELGF